MTRTVAQTADRLVLLMLRGYQAVLSPLFAALGSQCRFEPSCSQYMIDAVQSRGALIGVILGLWRLVRCNPLNRGGYDPAPPPSELGPVQATTASAGIGHSRQATRPESVQSCTRADSVGFKPTNPSRFWTNPDKSGQIWTPQRTIFSPRQEIAPLRRETSSHSAPVRSAHFGQSSVGDAGQDVSRETI